MNSLKIGTLRRTINSANATSARDLVNKTLAQHGLMSADGLPSMSSATLPQMPSWLTATAGPAVAPAALTPGASFQAERFTHDTSARDYMIYVPASASPSASGVVMMLHGCTQTHMDFAAGTGMNDLAEQHGFIVVYPQQSRGDNAQSCWNWFSRGDQRRGRGEPALLAALAAHVARDHDVPRARTFVAGLSAGAAMAVILGQTYADVFAGVGAHSGLPYESAKDVPSAFAAMADGGAGAMRDRSQARMTPTIVFHGTADRTVHPANGDRIAGNIINAAPEQTLSQKTSGDTNGRTFTLERTTTMEGDPLLELWSVEGLGHAWSGGRASGSYTDPAGPDASAEMVRFFFEQAVPPAPVSGPTS